MEEPPAAEENREPPYEAEPQSQYTPQEEQDLYQTPEDTAAQGEATFNKRSMMSTRGAEREVNDQPSVADVQQYEYGEDLGVTAVALYDYQAGEDDGTQPDRNPTTPINCSPVTHLLSRFSRRRRDLLRPR